MKLLAAVLCISAAYAGCTNKGWSYCRTNRKCGAGLGDCDKNSECATGLTCQSKKRGQPLPGWAVDCCNCPTTIGNGGWHSCNSACKCGHNQGDCDSNSQCKTGTSCRSASPTQSLPGSAKDYCCYNVGGWHACNSGNCKCHFGQGDCDANNQCSTGLVCRSLVRGQPLGGASKDYCCPSSDGVGAKCSSTCKCKPGLDCTNGKCANPPTKSPTKSPTKAPTKTPTKQPTKQPTKAPTKQPTKAPTKAPTKQPTKAPTKTPTKAPTKAPTKTPTKAPTKCNKGSLGSWGYCTSSCKCGSGGGDCDYVFGQCQSGLFCHEDFGGKVDYCRSNKVSFQSKNYPKYYIRHAGYLGYIHSGSATLFKKDATWYIEAPLYGSTSNTNYVSLRSSNYPNYYLRHSGYRLRISKVSSATLYKKDATFLMRSGLAGGGSVSFRSLNYPGRYIRHRSYQLWLDSYSSLSLYKNDASFYIKMPSLALAAPVAVAAEVEGAVDEIETEAEAEAEVAPEQGEAQIEDEATEGVVTEDEMVAVSEPAMEEPVEAGFEAADELEVQE